MDRREKILLFLQSHDRWFHGRELAGLFEVSTRTIRSDVAAINRINEQLVIFTDKQNGYRCGFQFTVEKKEYTLPGSFQERLLYEVKSLLVNESFDFFEMAETLGVSEATIDIDMSRFRKFLVEYSFGGVILSKHRDLYLLQGVHKYKNNILYELGKYLFHNWSVEVFSPLFSDFKGICSLVQQNAIHYQYSENRYLKMGELCLDFALLFESCKTECASAEQPVNNIWEPFLAATVIGIQKRYGVGLITDGVARLEGKIEAAQQMAQFEKQVQNNFNNNKDIQKLYSCLAIELKEIYCIDVSVCEELYKNMIMHIHLSIQRMRMGYKYYNPLKEQILERYPVVIDIVLYLVRRVEELYDIKLDSSDLSFLVAYMGGIFSHVYQNHLRDIDLSILLISFESRSNLFHISRYIRDCLGTQKHFVVEINSCLEYSVIAELPRTYDIVVYASEDNASIPVQADIYLSSSFSAMDKVLFADCLKKRVNEVREEKFNAIFQRYFDDDLFVKKKNTDDSEKIIFELAEKMKKRKIVDSDFFPSVISREAVIPTSLDIQVALPHALIYDARATKIATAILDQPVQWGSYKVRVVFLLASAKKDEESLHLFVEFISEALSKEGSREKMRQVETFKDIRDFFLDFFMN